MVVKYLLATLSALAKKLTQSSATNTSDDSDAIHIYKDGINYLNVSPIFRRLPKRRRWTIDLLPKSIIMAMLLIALSSMKLMGQTITITSSNPTQTYGSIDLTAITYTVSGGTLTQLPSYTCAVTSTSGAGSYAITWSGALAPGYTIVYVQGTFTVNKATLNIVATGPPKSVNTAVTSPQSSTAYFTASGLVNSETVSSVTLTISPATAQSAGQSYNVVPSAPVGANGFSTSNYTITYTTYNGACGGNYTWTGNSSTTWSTPANWNYFNGTTTVTATSAPGTNDNVFIPGGTTRAPDITANTTVNTITFTVGTGATSTLTIDAGKTVTFLNGFTVNANANALVNMASTSSQVIVGTTSSHAIMDNVGGFGGSLTFSGGTVFITWGLNYIYNELNSTMIFNNGNTLQIGGTSGQLAMENDGFMYIGQQNSPCTMNIVNSQSFTNAASGFVFLASTSTINFLDNSAHDSHFTNNGQFTLQSDSYGTASIGTIPAGPTGHKNSFDGQYTVERYLSGQRGYRLIASPVYKTTSGSNNIWSLNYIQNAAYITGTSASGGFDKVSQGPTLYLFREDVAYSNASFISGNFQSINNLNSGNNATPTYTFDVTSGSYSIPVSNGLLFFFRGNKYDTDGNQIPVATETQTSYVATEATLSTTGYLNQQQVIFRDWYTPSSTALGFSNSNVAAQGFNLAANPYACSIDWEQSQSATTTTGIYTLNLSQYIYEFNPKTGNYDTYKKGGIHTNNGTRTIMSGQGFFVLALNGSAQLIFNEGAKSTSLQNTGIYLFMGKPADQLANNQSLRLELAKDTINKDDTFISFEPNTKTTLDFSEDAPYRQGSGKVSLATMSSDNHPLAVNLLPFNIQGQTIPVKVGANTEGAYSLNMKEINGIPKLFDVLLADNDLKDTADMRKGPYSFNVSWADTNSYGAHRFAIIMRQNPAYAYQLLDFNAHKATSAREVQVVWNTKYEENYTNFTVERSVDGGQTFDVLGAVSATSAGNYAFTDKNPVTGTNVYRLKQEDINNKITYSKVVPIGYATTNNNLVQNNINIYPNPAAGKINLAIASTATTQSGSYNIMISNSQGNMLKKITSNQPTWTGDATGWMPGTYMVKVFDAKTQSLIGTTKFIKL